MKKPISIYKNGDHEWIAIARDPSKKDNIIDTIEYLILKGNKGCILDPGGIEVFSSMFNAIASKIEMKDIEFLFSSHQDPDIISSLPLWISLNPSVRCYCSWLWSGFIPHFGCEKDTLMSIPDEGMDVNLNGLTLKFIPAHYLHSSGNFNVYDPEAKILFSGDLGAAILPEGSNADIFVKDFGKHTEYMKGFHQRWMGSNEAKNNWVERVSKLDIDMMVPQHGAIFQKDDVQKFLQWLRELEVGSAIKANLGARP